MNQGISLGIFNYINVWPVYYDFLFEKVSRETPFQLVFGNPSELNQRFKNGTLSVSALSSNQYPYVQETASLIPSLALASRGPVRSVLLVSSKPLNRLADHPIFVTQASATSTVLLKILLKKMNVRVEMTGSPDPLTQLKAHGGAALLIGDEALSVEKTLPDYLRFDLGELWLELTGQPFVWAIWGIQNTVMDHAETVSRALSESRRHGLSAIRQLAIKGSTRLGLNRKSIEDYYSNFRYELTDEGMKSLLWFYRMAHELDLGPRCDSVQFAEGEKRAACHQGC